MTGFRRMALAVAVLALLGAGCDQDVSHEEESKARDLQAELADHGQDVSEGVAVSLYGTDGGAVCDAAAHPGIFTSEAASLVSHRFTLRKTEAHLDDVRYVRAVVKTYCPDELGAFDDYVDSLAVGSED